MATETDNVNAGAIGTLVAVLSIAVLAVALALTALVRGEAQDSVGAETPNELLEARRVQAAELDQPAAWVDKGAGHVSVPISRAMELTAADLKADPQSATPYPPQQPDAGAEAAAVAEDAGADAGGETADATATGAEGGAEGTGEAPAPQPQPAPGAPAPEAPTPEAPAPAPQPAPPPNE
ncbi:MAG: hypothetical protein R3B13_09885 [Polyangiaceae bacterium]